MPEKYNLKDLLAEIVTEPARDDDESGSLTQAEIRVLFARRRAERVRHGVKRRRVPPAAG